jgi:hypothetical protein
MWTLGNNFCCPRDCYSGSCNSRSGQCQCPPGFSGPSCTDYSFSLPSSNTSRWAVVLSKVADSFAQRFPVTRCANPATNASAVALNIDGSSSVHTETVPYDLIGSSSVIPGVVIQGSPTITGTVSGLYCGFDPLSYLNGSDPRRLPVYSFVEIVNLPPNIAVSRVHTGSLSDLEGGYPADAVLYRLSPPSTGPGASHLLEIKSVGECAAGLAYSTPGGPVPSVPVASMYGRSCSSSSSMIFGGSNLCVNNLTMDLTSNPTGDLYLLMHCVNGSVTELTYRFVAPPPTSICSSRIATQNGVLCNSTITGATLSLSSDVTFDGSVYIPPSVTLLLNGYSLTVNGDFLFSGVINTTWSYGAPRLNKRATEIANVTIASTGTIGYIDISGTVNLGNSSVNVQINSSSLPPGSASSGKQETFVEVYPITYDSSSGNIASHQTTISNENDPCVNHNVKSSQATPKSGGLQVLFSFETNPTGACATPGAAVVAGNEVNAALIGGIIAACIGGLLIIGLIAYLASPKLRAMLTPYKDTNV